MGTTSFLQISSQNVTILDQTCWKDEVGDVSAVPLQLQECGRETKVLQATKCTESPTSPVWNHFLHPNERGKCVLGNKY